MLSRNDDTVWKDLLPTCGQLALWLRKYIQCVWGHLLAISMLTITFFNCSSITRLPMEFDLSDTHVERVTSPFVTTIPLLSFSVS